MKEKWTCEQANEWYAKQGWLRGCNFIGSDCANRLDMYQAHRCEEKLSLELSDVISFHSYHDYVRQVEELHYLQQFNRPIFRTDRVAP